MTEVAITTYIHLLLSKIALNTYSSYAGASMLKWYCINFAIVFLILKIFTCWPVAGTPRRKLTGMI